MFTFLISCVVCTQNKLDPYFYVVSSLSLYLCGKIVVAKKKKQIETAICVTLSTFIYFVSVRNEHGTNEVERKKN